MQITHVIADRAGRSADKHSHDVQDVHTAVSEFLRAVCVSSVNACCHQD